MEITIETTFVPLILAHDDLPVGVKLIHQPAVERRSVDYSAIVTGVLTFSSSVSASIIAAWIYDKIKKVKDKPAFRIKINDKIVQHIDENSITEMIQREIKITKK